MTGAVPGTILVIGYGNSLRSDDGVGPAVAARLAADSRMAGVEVRAEHQLTPELAPDTSRASLLVLVDAGAEEAPGEVSVRWLATGSGALGPGAWTHHVDPAGLVGLARELYGAAPEVALVSIGPASLDLGEALTPVVEAAVAVAVEAVVALVASWRSGEPADGDRGLP